MLRSVGVSYLNFAKLVYHDGSYLEFAWKGPLEIEQLDFCKTLINLVNNNVISLEEALHCIIDIKEEFPYKLLFNGLTSKTLSKTDFSNLVENNIGSRITNYPNIAYEDANKHFITISDVYFCLLYTSPSPRDRQKSRMPSSA